jgi:hypothetical protein
VRRARRGPGCVAAPRRGLRPPGRAGCRRLGWRTRDRPVPADLHADRSRRPTAPALARPAAAAGPPRGGPRQRNLTPPANCHYWPTALARPAAAARRRPCLPRGAAGPPRVGPRQRPQSHRHAAGHPRPTVPAPPRPVGAARRRLPCRTASCSRAGAGPAVRRPTRAGLHRPARHRTRCTPRLRRGRVVASPGRAARLPRGAARRGQAAWNRRPWLRPRASPSRGRAVREPRLAARHAQNHRRGARHRAAAWPQPRARVPSQADDRRVSASPKPHPATRPRRRVRASRETAERPPGGRGAKGPAPGRRSRGRRLGRPAPPRALRAVAAGGPTTRADGRTPCPMPSRSGRPENRRTRSDGRCPGRSRRTAGSTSRPRW